MWWYLDPGYLLVLFLVAGCGGYLHAYLILRATHKPDPINWPALKNLAGAWITCFATISAYFVLMEMGLMWNMLPRSPSVLLMLPFGALVGIITSVFVHLDRPDRATG